MPKLRELLKRSKSDNAIDSLDGCSNDADTVSPDLQAQEPKKNARTPNKLRRRSAVEVGAMDLQQSAAEDDVNDSPAFRTVTTRSSKPKHEGKVDVAICESTDGASDSPNCEESTKRSTLTSKLYRRPWGSTKQALSEQTEDESPRTRSQAITAAAVKRFSLPAKLDKAGTSPATPPVDRSNGSGTGVTFKPSGTQTAKSHGQEEEPVKPCQPLTDITKIKMPVTAYLPPGQAKAIASAHKLATPLSSPDVLTTTTPQQQPSIPTPQSSPATPKTSSPSPTSSQTRARVANGPRTCTYETTTRTGLGTECKSCEKMAD